ncbi:hypothetical protein KBZ21_38895, partial [Streptomyces sp. A73]|nr:hypothetical protein [Streptomyces sp. A73]
MPDARDTASAALVVAPVPAPGVADVLARLEARIRLLMRTGEARNPQDMWAMATGTAAAWAFHRTLQRLT